MTKSELGKLGAWMRWGRLDNVPTFLAALPVEQWPERAARRLEALKHGTDQGGRLAGRPGFSVPDSDPVAGVPGRGADRSDPGGVILETAARPADSPPLEVAAPGPDVRTGPQETASSDVTLETLGLPLSVPIDPREAMAADFQAAPDVPSEVVQAAPVQVQQSSVDFLADLADLLISNVTGIDLVEKERRLHTDAYAALLGDAGIARLPGVVLTIGAWALSIVSRIEAVREVLPWAKSKSAPQSVQRPERMPESSVSSARQDPVKPPSSAPGLNDLPDLPDPKW